MIGFELGQFAAAADGRDARTPPRPALGSWKEGEVTEKKGEVTEKKGRQLGRKGGVRVNLIGERRAVRGRLSSCLTTDHPLMTSHGMGVEVAKGVGWEAVSYTHLTLPTSVYV